MSGGLTQQVLVVAAGGWIAIFGDLCLSNYAIAQAPPSTQSTPDPDEELLQQNLAASQRQDNANGADAQQQANEDQAQQAQQEASQRQLQDQQQQQNLMTMQAAGALANSIGSMMARQPKASAAASQAYRAPTPAFSAPAFSAPVGNQVYPPASNAQLQGSSVASTGSGTSPAAPSYGSHPEMVANNCLSPTSNGQRVLLHNRCAYPVIFSYCALPASNVDSGVTCGQGSGTGTVAAGGDGDAAMNMAMSDARTPGPPYQVRWFACRSDTGAPLVKVDSNNPLEGQCMAWDH